MRGGGQSCREERAHIRLEELALGPGGRSCAGLGPGCWHGKGCKLQGVRGFEKGLCGVRNWTLAHEASG